MIFLMPLNEISFSGRAVTHNCDTMDDEELAKYPGLQRRNNGVWYVRKSVPMDLIHVEPRSSIRLSLDTTEKSRAIRLYPFKLAAIEQHFIETRNRLQSKGRVADTLAIGKLERLSEHEVKGIVSTWWADRIAARQPVAETVRRAGIRSLRQPLIAAL